MKSKLMGFILIMTVSVFTTACGTMKGVGKDIESGGEKVQEASDDVKDSM